MVSIIIPSKDNPDTIERCISSLTEKTGYKNYELVVVDNGSSKENRAKYETLCSQYNASYNYKKMDFNFSQMCNIGAGVSKGEYLLFLNDDIEIIEKDWLENMLGQACQKHSGAVGAKLCYPDSTVIQHCGVINLPVGPSHAFLQMDDTVLYPFCRNRVTYNYIAVTAACLCVSRAKFDEAGGFDEELAVAYNDIDLCFKLYEHGYYNSVRNDAVLYHYESLSRGSDTADPVKFKRLISERELLYSKHPALKNRDPFYNENLARNRIDYQLDDRNRFDTDRLVEKGVNIAPLINDERVKVYLDRLDQGDFIEITGWAFIAAMPLNNFNIKQIVLTDENDGVFLFGTRTVLRTDVSGAFGDKNNLNLSGFNCIIDSSSLSAGKYRVGVLLKNRFTFKKYVKLTDKYVEIQKTAD